MTRRLIREDLAAAVDALQTGGLVALPTETVYGLAADATDPAAIARIFAVKGRPADHPLIVHLADASDFDRWAPDAAPAARLLAATCWPGPMTLIVPRSDTLPPEVAGGRDTVGLRVPAHPLAQELIRLVGTPLAAPSANRFGAVSPTTADHVRRDLGDEVDVVLDGGACPVGVESTIVDTTVDPVQILRVGAITADQVATLLDATVAEATGPARASGMLASHYAPACQVRLVDSPDDATALAAGTPRSRVLDLTSDIGRYARDLYAELRRADSDGVATLIAVLPEPDGLGHAVRDRLTRASAPRSLQR